MADMGSPWVPETTATTFERFGAHHVLRPQQDAVGNVQQAKVVGDFGNLQHAAPEQRHAAAEIVRQVENLLRR